MLFTVTKSPFEHRALDSCLESADADTPILLYEDAVYAAVAGTRLEETMKEALKKKVIYVLEPDLKARGLEKLIDGFKLIDYSGFVKLVEEHNICPWT